MLTLLLLSALPQLSWPLDSAKVPAGKTATAEEVRTLALEALPGDEGAPLRELTVPCEEGTSLSMLGEVKRPPFTYLVVRLDEEAAMMSVSTTFVLVKDAKGVWRGSAVLGATTSSEAASIEERGTLTREGVLSRKRTTRVPMHDEGLPEELVLAAERKGQLGADGVFTSSERITSPDGAFIDRTSNEELRVFGERVFYRSNQTRPFHPLLREKSEVRFKKGGAAYRLSWSADLLTIECANPNGTVQRFTREW